MFFSTCYFQEDHLAELPGSVFHSPSSSGAQLRLTGFSGGEAWNCIGDGQYWKWRLEKQSSLSNPTHMFHIYKVLKMQSHFKHSFSSGPESLVVNNILDTGNLGNWLLCCQFDIMLFSSLFFLDINGKSLFIHASYHPVLLNLKSNIVIRITLVFHQQI